MDINKIQIISFRGTYVIDTKHEKLVFFDISSDITPSKSIQVQNRTWPDILMVPNLMYK